jgi:hypothetical protein
MGKEWDLDAIDLDRRWGLELAHLLLPVTVRLARSGVAILLGWVSRMDLVLE